jgi:mannose-6-phosphate isomerase-like protein (cupin superfamily)
VFVRKLKDCPEFLAGDHTILRELVHPQKASLELRYSVAYGRLDPHSRSKRHRLQVSELYYFLAGRGVFHVGEETAVVESAMVVYVPPGTAQAVENTGEQALEFLCLVDPAWRPDLEQILE